MITAHPASPYLSAGDRTRLAIENLQAAVDELCALGDSDPSVVMHFAGEIDEAETQLAMLRPRLRMKRSLIHLTGAMGRPL
jgi:hypothetical protein